MDDKLVVDPRADLKQLLLENKIDYLLRDIRDIKEQLKGSYVTQDQFAPVRAIVYGLVSIILLSVVGAFLTLVLTKNS